jgi:hypothetical protein
MIGEVADEAVKPPGVDVTVYDTAPIDGSQATVASPLPATVVIPVGVGGGRLATTGTTAALGAEALEVPAESLVVTLKV